MVGKLLLSVQDAIVTFGGKPLFNDLTFHIHQNERICLVGKNGAGKTTLMQLITGHRELDGGERKQEAGVSIGYLEQDIPYEPSMTVFECVYSGLHPDKQNEMYHYMVDMILEPLELSPDAQMQHLSGGQMRRAALARALVDEPDILLLDEPTNHLDLHIIEWLENYLKNYRGTFLCISHDRTFLSTISNKVFWLDRGGIRICPKGFAHFDAWSEELLALEARELRNRERVLSQELEWASRGVKARRKRNMQRLDNMKKERERLKQDQSSYRQATNSVALQPLTPTQLSQVAAEFFNVSKSFKSDNEEELVVLKEFNMRITRGDRIGIIGKNGTGKSTFLKLLTKKMKPDQGKVKLSHLAEVSYFDQQREGLDPQKSLWETLCPDSGDYVKVGEKMRHVCGYLKDFLFDPKHARDLVATLSGGQKNRLMLAKVLANPGNILILDEPTNDLDTDTLDVLEDTLSNYKGTLIIVSHDRDFLDQTVTKVLAFEGDGDVELHVGGYSDYMHFKKKNKAEAQEEVTPKQPTKPPASTAKPKPKTKPISFKLKHEYATLPEAIRQLETELAALHKTLNSPELYQQQPETFQHATEQFSEVKQQLDDAETRWLELEEIMHNGT